MRDEFERQLALLNEELTTMGGLIESAIANAVKALDGDEHSINKAYDYEKSIDNKEREIESLCLKLLLTQQPVASDLRLISAALKMITDMERIGDQAEDIAEIASTAKKKMLKKSKHIQRMAAATIDMVIRALRRLLKRICLSQKKFLIMTMLLTHCLKKSSMTLWILLKKMRGRPKCLICLWLQSILKESATMRLISPNGCSSLLQANIKDYNLFSVFPFSPITVYI